MNLPSIRSNILNKHWRQEGLDAHVPPMIALPIGEGCGGKLTCAAKVACKSQNSISGFDRDVAGVPLDPKFRSKPVAATGGRGKTP